MAPHPLARRTCEPRPLVQAGQIGPAPLAGAIKTLGPAGRSSRRTARNSVSRIGGQAGTQASTLRPHRHKTTQAGPEALSTVSLPNIYTSPRAAVIALSSTHQPVRGGLSAIRYRRSRAAPAAVSPGAIMATRASRYGLPACTSWRIARAVPAAIRGSAPAGRWDCWIRGLESVVQHGRVGDADDRALG